MTTRGRSSGTTLAERLAAFVVETDRHSLPPEVEARVGLLLLDAVGIAIANRDQEYLRGLLAVLRSSVAPGPARPIGLDHLWAAEGAAEAMSAAIHGSDLDSTHLGSITHPTAITVPAALAVGQEVDATGAEVLVAIATGMEAIVRLGLAARGKLHLAGFQATALLGAVVAAMIAGRLRGRSADVTVAGAGLATAVAAGLRSFSDDGTWGKRLITGWACRAGIHADALAGEGWPGSRDGIEKRWGLLPAFVREPVDLDPVVDDLGRRWELLDVEVKRYPCSHGLHPYIASAVALRAQIANSASIAEVRCHVNREAARWWFEPAERRYRPDAYGARFSLPYAVARAFLDGRVDDGTFTPDAVADPAALAMTDRVRPVEDAALEGLRPVGLPGRMEVRTTDGRRHVLDASPDLGSPDELILGRFRAGAVPLLGLTAVADLERRLMHLGDEPSIRRLVAATVPPGPG